MEDVSGAIGREAVPHIRNDGTGPAVGWIELILRPSDHPIHNLRRLTSRVTTVATITLSNNPN